MEAFSAAYFEANPGVFSEADTAYTLAFSVIMLNTDHFNPSIRADRKMTRTQFISNNRAIDEALTPQFLGTMYPQVSSDHQHLTDIYRYARSAYFAGWLMYDRLMLPALTDECGGFVGGCA